MSDYVQAAMNPADIDALRFRAFKTGKNADQMAYYKAASGYFQDRHVRAMIRAALPATDAQIAADPRVQALVEQLKIELNSHQDDAAHHDENCYDEGKVYHNIRANAIRAALAEFNQEKEQDL